MGGRRGTDRRRGQSRAERRRAEREAERRNAQRQPVERGRRGRETRARRAESERQQRLITFAALGVLAAVVLIVLVGLYFTRYLPPRDHVLTVGSRDFNAGRVAERAAYMVLFEGGVATFGDAPLDAMEALIQQEVLRQAAPALVGEVTEEDVRNELMMRFGLLPRDDEEPAATPEATATATAAAEAQATATATATAAATETASPTPTLTAQERDEQFAERYQSLLQQLPISRGQFEAIVEAQILRQRLSDRFIEDVPEAGPQVRVARIRVNDGALAEDLRQQVVDGADIAELAREHSVGPNAEEGGDLGWNPRELLPDTVRLAIEGLEAEDVSQVLPSSGGFEFYQVTEAEESREYDDATRERLAGARVDEWVQEHHEVVGVERDLSSDEEDWIVRRLLDRVNELRAG